MTNSYHVFITAGRDVFARKKNWVRLRFVLSNKRSGVDPKNCSLII